MDFGKDIICWSETVRQALLAPFDGVLTRKGGGGMMLAYINAEMVEARLDAVVGPGNWSFHVQFLDAPTCRIAKGRLAVLGVVREDVGCELRTDMDEPAKAAVSDALKRCGEKFGIARYLNFTRTDRNGVAPESIGPALRAAGYTGPAAPVSDTRPAPKGHAPVLMTAPPAPGDDTRALGKMLMDLYAQVHGTGADREKMKADLAFLCEKTGDGPLTYDEMSVGISALQALIAEGDRATEEAEAFVNDGIIDAIETGAPLVVPCTFPSCSVKMTPTDAALSQKVHKHALCAKHSTMARAGMGG